MTLLYDLIRCRQLLMDAGAGRIYATVNAPIFYLIGYRQAEKLAAQFDTYSEGGE